MSSAEPDLAQQADLSCEEWEDTKRGIYVPPAVERAPHRPLDPFPVFATIVLVLIAIRGASHAAHCIRSAGEFWLYNAKVIRALNISGSFFAGGAAVLLLGLLWSRRIIRRPKRPLGPPLKKTNWRKYRFFPEKTCDGQQLVANIFPGYGQFLKRAAIFAMVFLSAQLLYVILVRTKCLPPLASEVKWGVFAGLILPILYLGISQFIWLETFHRLEVRTKSDACRPGDPLRVTVVLPGRSAIAKATLRLICIETLCASERSRPFSKTVYTETVLEQLDRYADPATPILDATAAIPPNAMHSFEGFGENRIQWAFEVTIKRTGWPASIVQFPFRVIPEVKA